MTSEPDKGDATKEGRIARHSRLAREAWDEPRSILRWSRDWLVRLWVTKGAGFYGLGYVITFVTLEARSISGDLGGGGDFAGFIASQFVQFIIRFSVESFLNAIFAVIWPVWVLQSLEGWGVVALIAGFIAFRFVVRPAVETWFPELREAREAKQAKKARKAVPDQAVPVQAVAVQAVPVQAVPDAAVPDPAVPSPAVPSPAVPNPADVAGKEA